MSDKPSPPSRVRVSLKSTGLEFEARVVHSKFGLLYLKEDEDPSCAYTDEDVIVIIPSGPTTDDALRHWRPYPTQSINTPWDQLIEDALLSAGACSRVAVIGVTKATTRAIFDTAREKLKYKDAKAWLYRMDIEYGGTTFMFRSADNPDPMCGFFGQRYYEENYE